MIKIFGSGGEDEINDGNTREALNISNNIQVKSVLLYIVVTIGLASMGIIGKYSIDLILHDLGVSFLLATTSVIFVKAVTKLSTLGILQANDSRKTIHMFSAPLFMVLWPFFSNLWGARIFAAMVAFIQVIRLVLAGTERGGSEGDELASAISRTGKPDEVLAGPLIYTLVLLATILLFWRDNLSSVVVLSTMAAGDGAADIVGRRLGKNNRWFFNKDKSIAGTLAFFVASSLCSIALLWWFSITGIIASSSSLLTGKIVLICAICAIVELLPLVDDNWSVPISAAFLSQILL